MQRVYRSRYTTYMRSPAKLIFIGNIAIQTVINKRLSEEYVEVGGSAWYIAFGAACVAKTGTVGIVATLGSDHEALKDRLRNLDIDTQGIVVDKLRKTASFHVVEQHNVRNFVARMNAAEKLHLDKFPNAYKYAKHIHLASDYPKRQLAWIAFLKQYYKSRITISAVTFEAYVKDYPEETIAVLQQVDMLFMNEMEYRMLRRLNFTPKMPYILQRGAKGASYYDKRLIVSKPAPRVDVVSTNGAGEVLAGVFLASRIQGYSVSRALKIAVILASRSVQTRGVEHLALICMSAKQTKKT